VQGATADIHFARDIFPGPLLWWKFLIRVKQRLHKNRLIPPGGSDGAAYSGGTVGVDDTHRRDPVNLCHCPPEAGDFILQALNFNL
jgi:hypothetical protein